MRYTKLLLMAGVAQIGARVALQSRWDQALALGFDTAIMLLIMGLVADGWAWIRARRSQTDA